MTSNDERTLSATNITEAIRASILTGTLQTGSEVVIADLSEALDTTMSDVRQALFRLADQHLVTVATNGSFRVVTTSQQDLRELTEMRQLLEGEAVRLAVERQDKAWAERLRIAFESLESAGAVENPGLDTTWRVAHRAFHAVLCSGCNNRRLLIRVDALRDEAEIYRELSAAAMTAGRRVHVDREHREMLDLALARDSDGAAAKVRAHLEGTMRSVVDSAGERTDG